MVCIHKNFSNATYANVHGLSHPRISHVININVLPMSIGFMSHVDFFKNGPCHVIDIFPMSIIFVSHVDLKKWPCHPVGFKGHPPGMERVFVRSL